MSFNVWITGSIICYIFLTLLYYYRFKKLTLFDIIWNIMISLIGSWFLIISFIIGIPIVKVYNYLEEKYDSTVILRRKNGRDWKDLIDKIKIKFLKQKGGSHE